MDTLQRRHYSRIRFRGNARFQTGINQWACEILDVSLRGALLDADLPPEIALDTPCLLEMILSDDTCVRMSGRLVHRAGRQIGMACDETDLDSLCHLRRLLALNLGNADLLEREFAELISA
ncbi:MAG: PilZ domain-containing protein [Azoarcus sp.]|nr:PilZ domain-containing protein [Azoarcus sp.]